MIKNLHKVQKKLSKKRGKLNALHENSRDSKILRRAGGREERLARLSVVTSKERQGLCKCYIYYLLYDLIIYLLSK